MFKQRFPFSGIQTKLNNNYSCNMTLFLDDNLHLIRKDNDMLAKEMVNFYYHLKHMVTHSKPLYGR